MRETFFLREEFLQGLDTHQAAFGISLTEDQAERLADYYDLVQEHNPLLHLVGPSTAEEFAIRHILEALKLLEHLPDGANFADVGTGAGLPSIPCLLVRDDLKATLIESKEKKASFLNEAVPKLSLTARAKIVNRQFTEADPGSSEFITCRALDKFVDVLPKLIRWSGGRKLLLFGGPTLGQALQLARVTYVSVLMPMSRERYLFVSRRS